MRHQDIQREMEQIKRMRKDSGMYMHHRRYIDAIPGEPVPPPPAPPADIDVPVPDLQDLVQPELPEHIELMDDDKGGEVPEDDTELNSTLREAEKE